MANAFNDPRDIQFPMDVDSPSSSFDQINSVFGTSTLSMTPKRRRQTIHGNEIRKVNDEILQENVKCKTKRTKSVTVKRSTSSGTVTAGAMSSLVPQNRDPTLTGMVKGTIKRRVSTYVLKHKMKKLQDYSLPYQHDTFALLRETCNVRNDMATPSRALRSQKATPPPKPPRQKPPKNSNSYKSKTQEIDMCPVWKMQNQTAAALATKVRVHQYFCFEMQSGL